MRNLGDHTPDDGSILDLNGLMHLAYTEATKISLLAGIAAILAADLCKFDFCHNPILLAVKNLSHGNTAQTGYGISVPHLGKGCDSSLDEVVGVG